MFHSLFKFILDILKHPSFLSVWFLAILLIALLRKSALRIQFTLELIIILLAKVVKQLFLFLCLIFHTPLKRFRCLVLAVLRWWPWCIVFADWAVCLETIQCSRLSNWIKRLNNQSFLALFPHFPDIHQSVFHSHIIVLPIYLIPVCIDLWHLPHLTHLFHKSVSLQLLDPLLLLLFLFHQPILYPLPLSRVLLQPQTPTRRSLGSLHQLVFLLLPLVKYNLPHLIPLCLIYLAHCDESVTDWSVI